MADSMRYFWWMRTPLFWWVHSKATSEDVAKQLQLDPKLPVIYVLPKRSIFDMLVLRHHCEKEKISLPNKDPLNVTDGSEAGYSYLHTPGILQRKQNANDIPHLERLVKCVKDGKVADVQIVPVSILWGRNPGRGEKSFFRLLFSDDENAGMIQKLFIVMAQGRHNMVHFGQPTSLKQLVAEGAPVDQTAKKLRRVLRVHFHRQRTGILGHKLYNRDQVVQRLVKARPIQQLIAEESKRRNEPPAKAAQRAEEFAREIAADVQWPVIRLGELLLSKLWDRIYDGVIIRHQDRIKEKAHEGYEVVYVPNHRSHMDYLLMSYVIFKSDLPTPHIAAGINLNFWPIGGFLRRGGAFFIRRRFGGNKLYSTMFTEYVHYLLTQGYSMGFFPEGGRSRTGLLLAPKTGMLAMVVQSFLRSHERPIMLVPVHLDYDKVAEVRTYLKELSGNAKRQESFRQILQARKIIKQYFGKAYIGFGEPIYLENYLANRHQDWRQYRDHEEKPLWLNQTVQDLAIELTVRNNASVVVSAVSLISLALLATHQKAMPEDELIGFVDKLLELLKVAPYSKDIVLPEEPFKNRLAEAEKLEMFQRFRHIGGDVIYVGGFEAILTSYYKNNVIHLFALPSLIARFFQYQEEVAEEVLLEGCLSFYPFLRDEFFLRWSDEEAPQAIKDMLGAMVACGLLQYDAERRSYYRADVATVEFAYQTILGRALGLVFERCTLTIGMLSMNVHKKTVDRITFENQCQKLAQRLAILSGVHTPDTSDPALFKNQINLLRRMGYIRIDDKDRIVVNERITVVANKTRMLLSSDIRQSIEKIGATT